MAKSKPVKTKIKKCWLTVVSNQVKTKIRSHLDKQQPPSNLLAATCWPSSKISSTRPKRRLPECRALTVVWATSAAKRWTTCRNTSWKIIPTNVRRAARRCGSFARAFESISAVTTSAWPRLFIATTAWTSSRRRTSLSDTSPANTIRYVVDLFHFLPKLTQIYWNGSTNQIRLKSKTVSKCRYKSALSYNFFFLEYLYIMENITVIKNKTDFLVLIVHLFKLDDWVFNTLIALVLEEDPVKCRTVHVVQIVKHTIKQNMHASLLVSMIAKIWKINFFLESLSDKNCTCCFRLRRKFQLTARKCRQ